MKKESREIWSSKAPETLADDIDSMAYPPSGGRRRQWQAGFFLALLPVIYGLYGLHEGESALPWRDALPMKGEAGAALSAAWISAGAFLHFHYFWGLSDRLWRFSQPLKGLSLIAFLVAFVYAHYRVLV